MIVIPHNVELCKQYFLHEYLLSIRKPCNRFSVIASMEKTSVGIKTCKREKTTIFIVNKRLKEANVKFLIEHDKRNSNSALLPGTLYTEETPDANI